MFRYAFRIEYDGSCFHGWQKQKNLETIQGTLNRCINILDPISDGVIGAGRTDAGVHATGQVAHVDLKAEWDPSVLRNALNYHLRNNKISVIEAVNVPTIFHSRFSAIKRYYVYKFFCRAAPLALEQNRYWHLKRSLNIQKMKAGASHLIGHHDFTTFRSALCQSKSPVKSIGSIAISELAYATGSIIEIHIAAKSFLHNQVRSIAGTLEKVGSGAWSPNRVAKALEAKDRSACGPVAPAGGLYLVQVDYEKEIFQTTEIPIH